MLSLFLVAVLLCQTRAHVTIYVQEVGTSVVATGSGSLNLTALSLITAGGGASSVFDAVHGVIQLGPAGAVDIYSGLLTGPTSFGLGSTFAGSGSGDRFGVQKVNSFVVVPSNYVSGGPLSGSATWILSSFSSLGLAPGSYTWTWGSGATADSITIQIGPCDAGFTGAACNSCATNYNGYPNCTFNVAAVTVSGNGICRFQGTSGAQPQTIIRSIVLGQGLPSLSTLPLNVQVIPRGKGIIDPVVTVTDNADGTYTASWTYAAFGTYLLDISVSEQPVANSPYTITVHNGNNDCSKKRQLIQDRSK